MTEGQSGHDALGAPSLNRVYAIGQQLAGLAVVVLMVASMWKVFTKAGKPGWAAIIPIYNLIVLLQIAGNLRIGTDSFFGPAPGAPPIAVYVAGLIIPSVQVKAAITALWLTVLILLLVDSTVIGLRIRKLMRERYPDSDQKMSGLVFYGATRATMIRRWRSPKPVVEVGDAI